MPRRRRIVSGSCLAERKAARKAVGSLSASTILPYTRKRYARAVQAFFHHLKAHQLPLAASLLAFDAQVAQFIDVLWQEGESRACCGDLISGLQWFVPGLRRNLNASWRLHKAWGMRELPRRAPPIPLLLAHAMAMVAIHWQCFDASLAILLGFLTYLRTSELLDLHVRQCTFVGDNKLVIQLPETKGTARSGAVESVTLVDELLVPALRRHLAGKPLGHRLLQRSPPQFRTLFRRLTEELGVTESGFTPYSLRRGGATFAFQKTGKLDPVTLQGRWRDASTARIYINSGLLELVQASFPPATTHRLLAFQAGLLTTFSQA